MWGFLLNKFRELDGTSVAAMAESSLVISRPYGTEPQAIVPKRTPLRWLPTHHSIRLPASSAAQLSCALFFLIASLITRPEKSGSRLGSVGRRFARIRLQLSSTYVPPPHSFEHAVKPNTFHANLGRFFFLGLDFG